MRDSYSVDDKLTKIIVNLNERSYPIFIGEDLLKQNLLIPHIIGQQVFIVTNETVAPLYLAVLKSQFKDYQCDDLILPDGEVYKTIDSVQAILTHLLNEGIVAIPP